MSHAHKPVGDEELIIYWLPKMFSSTNYQASTIDNEWHFANVNAEHVYKPPSTSPLQGARVLAVALNCHPDGKHYTNTL